jgi:hypothetical protein
MPQSQAPVLRERVYILLAYLFLLSFVNFLLTENWLPKSSGEGLWFVSAVGLVSFNLLSAPFFVKPKDALARSLAGLLLLLSLDLNAVSLFRQSLNVFRWLSVGLSLTTICLAALATVLHRADSLNRLRASMASRIAYRLSTNLGMGAIVFTPTALISIFGFNQSEPIRMLVLGFVWIVLVAMQPVELVWRCLKDVGRLRSQTTFSQPLGLIERIDSPGIIRVRLEPDSSWNSDDVYIACLPDSKQVHLLPLFKQIRNNVIVGTGLCCAQPQMLLIGASAGAVYRPAEAVNRLELVRQLSSIDAEANLIGFVVEQSTISAIRFEVSGQHSLREGHVIFCRQDGETIYYQILDAQTSEESFERNPHGTHVVTAAQLGTLDVRGAFAKFAWLPEMNSPFLYAAATHGESAGRFT